MIKTFLQSIFKWLVLAALVAGAGFLFIHFLYPKPQVTLPGGQVINLDTKSFNSAVNSILQKQNENGKKVNDLESEIRRLQGQVGTDIPVALRETDIRKSVERMRAAW